MAKQTQTPVSIIGMNVQHYMDGDIAWFGVDTSVRGDQSEGSKKLDKNGNQKQANELVGSTRSYTPVADGRVLLHYIRPMQVKQVRKARAMAELASEDDSIEKAKQLLKEAGLL